MNRFLKSQPVSFHGLKPFLNLPILYRDGIHDDSEALAALLNYREIQDLEGNVLSLITGVFNSSNETYLIEKPIVANQYYTSNGLLHFQNCHFICDLKVPGVVFNLGKIGFWNFTGCIFDIR